MFNFIKKMVFNIKDVVVDKISLISRGKKPAVPKAETSFSIFKSAKKCMLTKEHIAKLEEIAKGYDGIAKAKKKTLYVSRNVIDGDNLIKFAKDQGIKEIIDQKELHVTVAFSKTKVDWSEFEKDTSDLDISLKNAKLEKLWDAIVIKFDSDALQKRWKAYTDGGASWDYDDYMPHISLSYNNDQDISKMDNFSWDLTLGGEILAEIDEEYLK